MKIINTSFGNQLLRDKAGKLHELAPGTEADIDIARDNIHLVAKERAGLIEVGKGPVKAAAKAEKKPE